MIAVALLLAQIAVPTPPVFSATPTPPPVSERAALSKGLADAAARAQALGGTLGAVVIDLASGASAQINADRSLPMQSVQKLPIAVLVYQSVDAGTLRADQTVHVLPSDLSRYVSSVADDYGKRTDYTIAELVKLMLEDSDNSAANALLRLLGGVDAANARLREMNDYGILLSATDDGFAKPLALASFLGDLQNGKLLSASSRAVILAAMSKSTTFPGRLRAGFPARTLVEHKTGTSGTTAGVTDATNDVGIVQVGGRTLIVVAMLHGARGDEAARDAILAAVGRAAYDAARQFPL